MRRVRTLSLLAAAGLATAAFAYQSVNQLQHNGKTVSTNLKVVDGTLMLPAKDVASYLGGELKVENGTATIIGGPDTLNRGSLPAGTAPYQSGAASPSGAPYTGPVAPAFSAEPERADPKELSVNVGQDATSGGFTLRILGVEDVEGDYRTQNDPRRRKIDRKLPDDRLVVVRMRIENGTAETKRPPVPGVFDVTLFDGNGVGYPVAAFDARPLAPTDYVSSFEVAPVLDAPILAPKGALEFAAVFSLPKAGTATRMTVALPPSGNRDGGANVTVDLNR